MKAVRNPVIEPIDRSGHVDRVTGPIARQPPSPSRRFTVFREHPSSFAIRFEPIPVPSALTSSTPHQAAASQPSARLLCPPPGTELRIASNRQGDGLTLAAVTEVRIFAYGHDEHKAAEVIVTPAGACAPPQ